MIEIAEGDLLAADAEALVNAVNCVGVMGRGIALQFKKAHPRNFEIYKAACSAGEVQPGRMNVFATNRPTNPKFIINFPTKRHWRAKSRLEDIARGLDALVEVVRAHAIRSIAIPPLGCGLGGQDWGVVRPMIVDAAQRMPETRVLLFEPGGVGARP